MVCEMGTELHKTWKIRNPNIEIRNKSKIRITECSKENVSIFVFGIFEFVSDFACLREAASAKAGISCFGIQSFLGHRSP